MEFLQQQSVITTHFMIGINIVQNPAAFQAAFNAGHHIAVHTWTHPYMTTLSNVDVLGQVGGLRVSVVRISLRGLSWDGQRN